MIGTGGRTPAGHLDGGFSVTRMFHPSHHVTDLEETEEWFQRVFGRTSSPLATMSRGRPPREGFPSDYSTFTLIADVLFDSIDPKRYVLLGEQRYATVDTPHLKAIGLYVDDMVSCFRTLRRLGIRAINQLDELAQGDEPPTAAGSPMPLFFTVPEDAGLRYELFPAIPFPLDPRLAEGWHLPTAEQTDPLRIERSAQHTVLTGNLERATRFAVEAMGGSVIHQGRNDARATTSTFIHLADSILEYAVPDPGTPAHLDWLQTAPDLEGAGSDHGRSPPRKPRDRRRNPYR
jgi:hypothetical protein